MVLAFACGIVSAQNGTLNLNFGDSGTTVIQQGCSDSQGTSLLLQPDGKIILGGDAQHPFFNYTGILARFLPSGDLDSTFGIHGVTDPKLFLDWNIYDLAFQADGKIVAAGIIGTYNFAVFRFLPNGSLDSNFGTNGVFSFEPAWFLGNGYAASIAVYGTKILVCGETDRDSAAVVLQLTNTGKRDSTFNGNGTKVLAFNGQNTKANDLHIQPDGKILIGGSVSVNGTEDMALFRLNSNGDFDQSFGKKGIVHINANNQEEVQNVLVQSDHTIIAVRNRTDSGINKIVVSRHMANGDVDLTYGLNGETEIAATGFTSTAAKSACMLPDDGVLIAGSADSLYQAQMVTRVFSNGLVDGNFGWNGFVLIKDSVDSFLSDIVAQGSAHFFVAGKMLDTCYFEAFLSGYQYQNSIGLDEFTAPDFKIYPNPSSGMLTIATKTPGVFTLYNNLGQEVWRGFVSAEPSTINLEHLPAGLYFMVDNRGSSQAIALSN